MEKKIIILGTAHGVNVGGKCSPDKKFREYKYSREIIKQLKSELEAAGYKVFVDMEGDEVPGKQSKELEQRCIIVNQLCRQYGTANCIYVSIHVNAAGSEGKWMNAGGWCAYTQSLEEESMALKSLTSEKSWQQTAMENNIDIRQATLATIMSEQMVKKTRAASLPSVAVVAENNLSGPYTSDLIPKNANVNVWFVGIGVKYNLSSLWKNNHDIRKARHKSTQAHESVQLAREGMENAVQANYTNLLTSSVEVSTQEKQVELADQNYSVVKNRYDNDLALLTDMLDASNMKLSADMALVNARINMLYYYFKLKYITNTL